ncbi:hypothetical protein RJ639_013937 [Escallonia herrerae]|uniref:Photolyase/cryptochrome alpha/beta domain-containing protein n=1 Tax=Escallonia herrerae TaxID=1293975 RepID=A0AA89AP61_9ASTE|nr:hypothetical protein RJ639_013937 [Escallonia herrerae]
MDELSLVGGAVFGDCAEGSWDLTERHIYRKFVASLFVTPSPRPSFEKRHHGHTVALDGDRDHILFAPSRITPERPDLVLEKIYSRGTMATPSPTVILDRDQIFRRSALPATQLRRRPPSVKISVWQETRASAEESTNTGTALLWFKHDLRIDDHPGLVAAARFKDEELELLLYAVKDLRQSLKDQGSNLVIRCGSAERVIRELVQEVNADSIFAEEELEYDLCMVVDSVKETIITVSYHI